MTQSQLDEFIPNVFLTRTDYTPQDVERACLGIATEDPVNAVISVFYRTVDPTVKFGSPFVRKHAAAVVKAFGPEGAVRLAKCAVAFRHRPYFPSVTSPKELAEKMAKVSAAVARIINDSKGSKVVVI